jgi:hypothetical protein
MIWDPHVWWNAICSSVPWMTAFKMGCTEIMGVREYFPVKVEILTSHEKSENQAIWALNIY